ncbi:chromosome partitioning protein [Mycobacterium avium]|nr:chromosome partitioning protein [Mycobacterium avium]
MHACKLVCVHPSAPIGSAPTPPGCEVIAVALQKGGVGKTTSTINLAANLALLGFRVLVIDMDQQAHSTKGLGLRLGPDDASMYEVLHPDRSMRVSLSEVIVTSTFNIDVAPADLAMRELERTGLGSGGQLRLARQLDDLSGYDYVLLDCPPALGELTTAALAAADYVLAVLKAGPDEVDGLVDLGNTIMDVQETLNPDIEIRYVLLADFDGRPQASRDVRTQLRADWGDWDDGGAYLGEIPHTVRAVEAKGKQVPIHVHAPTSTAALAYGDVARRMAERRRAA